MFEVILRYILDKTMMRCLIAVVVCLLVPLVVSKLPSTTFDVNCGNPGTNTAATLTYKGPAVAVFGYGPKHACPFRQDQQTGDFRIKISYNPNDTCSFRQGLQAHYNIKVESRMLHELFETSNDEKFLIECTFMIYKPNVSVIVDIKEKRKPLKYLFYPKGLVANSDFEIYVKGSNGTRLNGTVLEGTVVSLHTHMTPKASESTYMPLACLVESTDGVVKYHILASGCGTGFPFNRSEGFTMNTIHGDSPRFKMFRISRKQGIVFKCSFLICKGSCDGTTCKPRKLRTRRSLGDLTYNSYGLLTDDTKGIQRAAVSVHLEDDNTGLISRQHYSTYRETEEETPILLTLVSLFGILIVAAIFVSYSFCQSRTNNVETE